MASPRGEEGWTLVELLVVLGIVGIMLAFAVPEFSRRMGRTRAEECAQKLAADIAGARSVAQTQGRRTQLLVSTDGTPGDLAGDDGRELWLTFQDTDRDRAYDSGERKLSCGTCGEGVAVDVSDGAALSSCEKGGADEPGDCLWFSTLGTPNARSVGGRSVILTSAADPGYHVRVKMVSVTGYTEIEWCAATGTERCGDDAGWHPLY